jgi:hypothetical protein
MMILLPEVVALSYAQKKKAIVKDAIEIINVVNALMKNSLGLIVHTHVKYALGIQDVILKVFVLIIILIVIMIN